MFGHDPNWADNYEIVKIRSSIDAHPVVTRTKIEEQKRFRHIFTSLGFLIRDSCPRGRGDKEQTKDVRLFESSGRQSGSDLSSHPTKKIEGSNFHSRAKLINYQEKCFLCRTSQNATSNQIKSEQSSQKVNMT